MLGLGGPRGLLGRFWVRGLCRFPDTHLPFFPSSLLPSSSSPPWGHGCPHPHGASRDVLLTPDPTDGTTCNSDDVLVVRAHQLCDHV